MHYQSRVLVQSNPLVFPLNFTTLSFAKRGRVVSPPSPDRPGYEKYPHRKRVKTSFDIFHHIHPHDLPLTKTGTMVRSRRVGLAGAEDSEQGDRPASLKNSRTDWLLNMSGEWQKQSSMSLVM